MTKFMQTMREYFITTAGTIVVAFAVMAPLVIGASGMALDYAHAYLVQQRLAQAIDAAALAATASSQDEEVVEQRIRDFFEANYPPEKLGVTFEPEVHFDGDNIQVTGRARYNTFFLTLLGIETIEVNVNNQVTRSVGTNIELALVLDVSGSMAGTKVEDLKEAAKSLIDTVVYDNQNEYYSKVALVPYGVAVNVGSYAAEVRGPITAAKSITGVTKANPAVVTSNSHGFSNGDKIYITGVVGMVQLNSKIYTVANKTNNTFQLQNTDSRNYSTYKSAGSIYCTSPGCQYHYFQSPSSNYNTFQVSTCVSERTGAYAYKDDGPETAYVGRNYPPSGNPCLASKMVPLTNDKDELNEKIDDLVASGSTGGQVGVAWGWYLLSPKWDIWPEESIPAAYNTEKLHKIMVLMTDGEYNSPYCNGVIAKDATSGSGNVSDHINCNATNGNSYDQAEDICDEMKKPEHNIEIYTIGFKVDNYPRGEELMEYCATDEAHFYTADDGDELKEVFDEIANNVTAVYLSQ